MSGPGILLECEVIIRFDQTLDALMRLALQRNYKFDKYGTVWLPISVSQDASSLADPTGPSFLAVLRHIYFPLDYTGEPPSWFAAVGAKTVELPENEWLKSEFERQVRYRYREIYKKDAKQCLDLERTLFDEYAKDETRGMNSDQLLHALTTFDYFRIPPLKAASHFYIPTSTLRKNPGRRVPIARSGASGATHRLNQSDLRRFLYLDVGAWSSPQTRPGKGSAAFGMIGPDEVALWDLMAPKTQSHRPPSDSGTLVAEFLKSCNQNLSGDLIFYARFFDDRCKTYPQGNLQTHPYQVPVPFTANSVMFFIPDLHLHLFPNSAADNFLEPWRGGASLASCLIKVFDQIGNFSRAGHEVELYQVGDCYELWESALLLTFAHGLNFRQLFSATGLSLLFSQLLIDRCRDRLWQDCVHRGLNTIFSSGDLAKLQTLTWTDESLKPIWRKMKTAIQRAQVIQNSHGGQRSLFNELGRINHPDLSDWTIVGGNHDSFVTDVTPQRRGVNDAIFIEHGHLRDFWNSPATMLLGIALTGVSTAAEIKRVGDEAKGIEGSRRGTFLENAAKSSFDPKYEYSKPRGHGPEHYSIVVNGHSHRKYAALIEEDPRGMGGSQARLVFCEDPWPGFHIPTLHELGSANHLFDDVNGNGGYWIWAATSFARLFYNNRYRWINSVK
jgi:hypothetical protein